VSAERDDVVIIWENADEVVEDVEFYDEDGDGLFDRVSWVVPHLSKQTYSIEIVWGGEENSSYSNILLNVVSPENDSMVSNPVNFDINVSYNNFSDVSCLFSINGEPGDIILVEQNQNISKTFSDGRGGRQWEISEK